MKDDVQQKSDKKKLAKDSVLSSSYDAPAANDANPNHREDFTSLVNAAARKQKQGE